MKALQLSSFGSPTDVVELTEIEPDDPGPGQLAVAIEAAPINPTKDSEPRLLFLPAESWRSRASR